MRNELFDLLTAAQLDAAVDEAARALSATVALFMAAPSTVSAADQLCAEFAIEFFVPPDDFGEVAPRLNRALGRQSPRYRAARGTGRIGAPIVHAVPAGGFHQWHLAWPNVKALPISRRWSSESAPLRSLIRHVESSWSELLAI